MAGTIVIQNGPGGDPLAKLKKFEQAVYLGAKDAVTQITILTKTLAQTSLRDLGRVDRGTLRNSITVVITESPTVIRGICSADALYAVWVEFGRRGLLSSPPGMTPESGKAAWPNRGAIDAWALRNLVKLKGGATPRSQRSAEAKRIGFLVARKIALRGIRPSPFMRPAYAHAAPKFSRTLFDAVLRRRAALGI